MRFDRLKGSVSLKRPYELVNQKRQFLDDLERNLVKLSKAKIQDHKNALMILAGKLDALSPLTVLTRGYAVVQKPDGTVVRSADDLSHGDEFDVTVKDGKFRAIYDTKV